MLIFPEALIVKIICNNREIQTNDLTVILCIYAPFKNNYNLLKISDLNGEICFTRQDALNEIDESMNMFLMDYSSQLHECMEYVDLEICTTTDVENALKAMKLYVGIIPSITQEKIEQVKNSRNHLFYPKKVRVYLNEDVQKKEVFIEINEKK
ncbi:MAG: hypothetical protein SFU91_05790 [Chloroherpetonaceae bacterium]|nr:hypothetical protein [Chloroherpetonaceae bacterium]